MANVFPDPKWLELLKASGPQAAALALACLLLFVAPKWGILEPLPSWVGIFTFFFGVLAAALALFSFLSSAYTFIPLHKWANYYYTRRNEKKAALDYLPYMTPKEKEIIAYLLENNLKTFTMARDGGYAVTLISRGIVQPAVRDGQVASSFRTPAIIPDHIWDVLLSNRDKFPYIQPDNDPDTPEHPWRIHWMVQ